MDLIKAHLPKTYYAGLDSERRIEIFVEHWRRLVKVNQELQEQVDSIRVQPEVKVNFAGTTNGNMIGMKHCECAIPHKNGGDNYCKNCNGLIYSLLGNGGIANCPNCNKPY